MKHRKNHRPPASSKSSPGELMMDAFNQIPAGMLNARVIDAKKAWRRMDHMRWPNPDPQTEAERAYAEVYYLMAEEDPTLAGVAALKLLEAGEITGEECFKRVKDGKMAFLRTAMAAAERYLAENPGPAAEEDLKRLLAEPALLHDD